MGLDPTLFKELYKGNDWDTSLCSLNWELIHLNSLGILYESHWFLWLNKTIIKQDLAGKVLRKGTLEHFRGVQPLPPSQLFPQTCIQMARQDKVNNAFPAYAASCWKWFACKCMKTLGSGHLQTLFRSNFPNLIQWIDVKWCWSLQCCYMCC